MRSVIINAKYNNFDCHYFGQYMYFNFTLWSVTKTEARPRNDIYGFN